MSGKPGRPKGHKPGNTGRGMPSRRGPVRSAIPVVVRLFEIADADGRAYHELQPANGDNLLPQWRRGRQGPTVQMFMEVADRLGYELKLVKKGQADERT